MSLTQIDKDFILIKEKTLSENETFLKKFQNNVEYNQFKRKNKKSYTLSVFLVILFCALVAGAVYFLYKYLPDYFVYEIVIGISLILLSFTFLIIKITKQIKQEQSINKNGYYYAVQTIENCYDKLVSYILTINLNTATDEDKLLFYENLSKIFGNVSNKLSKQYSAKTRKMKKLNNQSLDWQWLIKYLYNFGKFCYNKKLDCKSFISLMSL